MPKSSSKQFPVCIPPKCLHKLVCGKVTCTSTYITNIYYRPFNPIVNNFI